MEVIPIVKKRIYQAMKLKSLDKDKLKALGPIKIIGIDVAKKLMVAVLAGEDGEVSATIKWNHPAETPVFLRVVGELGPEAVAVMEPTSTYGDALRGQLVEHGHEVYRANPKHTKDFAELFDGVPSCHDAKSAAILVELHQLGKTKTWEERSVAERELGAMARVVTVLADQYHANLSRVEALCARHWPELLELLSLVGASILGVLEEFGGPQAVAADPQRARVTLQHVSHRMLSKELTDAVVASATRSLGMEMVPEEGRMLQTIAAEANRNRREKNAHEKKLKKAIPELDGTGELEQMLSIVGPAATASLGARVGRPSEYGSAGAYLKAMGLNLKVRSSGTRQGEVAITKRGPSETRTLLYFATLRWIKDDPIARAWHVRKVARSGGKRLKSIVALMRKLVSGLWSAVRHGQAFDSSKLFDTSRLGLGTARPEEMP